MSFDARNARLVVVVAWAGLFLWLRATGQVARFIGPRNFWVVTFGGVALAVVAVVLFLIHPESDHRSPPLTRREAAGLAALLAPVLIVLVTSTAQLGSLAASHKLTARGIDLTKLPRPSAQEVGFLEINIAERHPDLADRYNVSDGRRVGITGFVLGNPAPGRGPFQLARFYITCCVADAIPLGVTVHPPPGAHTPPHKDQWLHVTGTLHHDGNAFDVDADAIRPASAPSNPYLTFNTG